MKDPFLMQRDRFVRMRGLFVGLGGHTKWVSSATTFTSFVFKVRRELSNSEIEKYINILNFKDLPLKLLKSDACRKCFFSDSGKSCMLQKTQIWQIWPCGIWIKP